MNQRTLEILEFTKIRNLLCGLAVTAMGREQCSRLTPARELEAVRALQAETAETRTFLEAGVRLPLERVREIRSAIWWAATDGVLSAPQLLEIRQTLAAAAEIRSLLAPGPAPDPGPGPAPRLAALAAELERFPDLEEHIDVLIDDEGQVRSTASPELTRVRQEMRAAEGAAAQCLHAILADPAILPHLLEPGVFTWDGRAVLHLQAGCEQALPGVVHQVLSRTGGLVVEPQGVVPLNNRVRTLREAERAEAGRLLAEVTAAVGARFGDLRRTVEALGRLDFIAARAALGHGMRAVTPALNGEGVLEIRRGRHPLLTGRVVPLDIRLGQDFDLLVITGPNTGGKTVALKTVGLFCAMAQAGLQVPAGPGTELPVLRALLADIGDEQSIEQNLSTFSGHISNIAAILAEADGGTLVLLDELGAGTDPAEGAALGKAILIRLQERGAKVVATTHLGELKSFAAARPRVENGSVEFNLANLRSTYRLRIGEAGESQAIAIAAQLGLDPGVVEEARRQLEGRPERCRVNWSGRPPGSSSRRKSGSSPSTGGS